MMHEKKNLFFELLIGRAYLHSECRHHTATLLFCLSVPDETQILKTTPSRQHTATGLVAALYSQMRYNICKRASDWPNMMKCVWNVPVGTLPRGAKTLPICTSSPQIVLPKLFLFINFPVLLQISAYLRCSSCAQFWSKQFAFLCVKAFLGCFVLKLWMHVFKTFYEWNKHQHSKRHDRLKRIHFTFSTNEKSFRWFLTSERPHSDWHLIKE